MTLLDRTDSTRLAANQEIRPESRSMLGQFMTPKQIAAFMCSLFDDVSGSIRLLDPGAGVGSLTAAFVDDVCARPQSPKSIHATAYEVDPLLASYLDNTLDKCAERAGSRKIEFSSQLKTDDFIHDGAEQVCALSSTGRVFTHIVMNPPYKKTQYGIGA